MTVDGLPEELKHIAPGIHWDSKRNTFYVRAMSLLPSDLSDHISRFPQGLGNIKGIGLLR